MSIRPDPARAVTVSSVPPGVAIREAAAGDIPRIVELLELGSLVAGKEDPSDLGPYRSALEEATRPPGAVLVAEVGGEVVGLCQLIVFRHVQARGGLCAEVESVHVHPDHRGQGIGRLLMGHVVERSRDLGCYRVQLTSNTERTRAHRFYESLGFTPSHRGFKLQLPGGRPRSGVEGVDSAE